MGQRDPSDFPDYPESEEDFLSQEEIEAELATSPYVTHRVPAPAADLE